MTGFFLRVAACALGLVTALAGCQPVDDIDDLSGAAPDEGDPEEGARRGAPAAGLPGTLTDVLARVEGEAARWQDDARLAEAALETDEHGNLRRGSITYLAADADRLLTVLVTPDGLRVERPTLATFELEAIPGDALAALPALPSGVREPEQLVAAAAEGFAACDVSGAAEDVLYSTGAPLAWNGAAQEWTVPLEWTATVTTSEGQGAVLDPETAEVIDCVRT